MSELVPPGSQAIVQELAHHQGQQELLQEKMDYHQKKIDACVEILKSSGVIWVEDERWQRGQK